MPRAPDLSGVALDGRYELRELIGEGTFGRVYRGRDRRLAREVAVKVIKPWWAEEPAWVAGFEREAQLLARVSDPGIVQVFDIGHAPEGLYYVAELIDGESLSARLRREERLTVADAVTVAEALARALGRAHARGIVHRDVKPANVLLGPDGVVKIGDFGVARLAEGSTDGGATAAGTPRYMAPEQARGGRSGPAADVYGLGVVLYEMLAGRPPFTGESAVELALAHLSTPPPPLPAAVPAAVRRVVARALAKAPHDRYVDGAAMAAALADARAPGRPGRPVGPEWGPDEVGGPADEPAGPADTQPAPPRPVRRRYAPGARRQRRFAFAVVGVVLLGLLGLALALRTDRARVPDVRGFGRARVDGTLARAGLRAAFRYRYAAARRGTAIAESPPAREAVDRGTVVTVTMSAGPAPVAVPGLSGMTVDGARAALARAGLAAGAIRQVAAPGVAAGTVVGQSPPLGVLRAPGTAIALRVAEPPAWRTLIRFSGRDAGRSVPFRIRGTRWRVVYSMRYVGTCTFIVFCSGPTLAVSDAGSGAQVGGFDLGAGSGLTHEFTGSTGVLEIAVTPGNDTAAWSVTVQDFR